MVLKYKMIKNSIKIFTKDKIISSNFKQCFLQELIKKFDLYEIKNKEFKKISEELIHKSLKISDDEIAEYKNFYEVNNIRDISFEEFLDSVKVNFSNIYVVNKGTESVSDKIAIIDFEPDGDINTIWIDTFQSKQQLFACIE